MYDIFPLNQQEVNQTKKDFVLFYQYQCDFNGRLPFNNNLYLVNVLDKHQEEISLIYIKRKEGEEQFFGTEMEKYNKDIKSEDHLPGMLYHGRSYNQGIFDVLAQDDKAEKFRIVGTTHHTPDPHVYFDIYLHKDYLFNIYEESILPSLLVKIMQENKQKQKNKATNYSIPTVKNQVVNQALDKTLQSYLQIKPYTHQWNNIRWMLKLEEEIKKQKTTISILKTSDLDAYYIESIDDYLFFDSQMNLYNGEKMKDAKDRQIKVTYQGGILCDEVGLGKTLSMVGLILKDKERKFLKRKRAKNPKIVKVEDKNKVKPFTGDKLKNGIKYHSQATLVIVPRHLFGQWKEEVIKYIDPKLDFTCYGISTIAQFRKYQINHLATADMVIITSNFLTSKKYQEVEDQLHHIKWHRIIFDEGHESLVVLTHLKKAQQAISEKIYQLKANYKWVCSATPLANGNDSFNGILKYLDNNWDETVYHEVEKNFDVISPVIFRRNTQESVKVEVKIPPIKEDNELLKQTPIEAAIYQSAAADKNELRMIQLCTHILVSEYDAEVLGDKLLPLEKVYQIMNQHYQNKIKYLQKNTTNLKTKYDEINRIKNKKEDMWKQKMDLAYMYLKKLGLEYLLDLKYDRYEKKDTESVVTILPPNPEIMKREKEKIKMRIQDQTKYQLRDITMMDDIDDNEIDFIKISKDDDDFISSESENEEDNLPINGKKKQKIYQMVDDYLKYQGQQEEYIEDYEQNNQEVLQKYKERQQELSSYQLMIKKISNIDQYVEEATSDPCCICLDDFDTICICICGHIFCQDCMNDLFKDMTATKCPMCRHHLERKDTKMVLTDNMKGEDKDNKWGTKMNNLIKYLHQILDVTKEKTYRRAIIFSQWKKMLDLVGKVLLENKIKFVYVKGSSGLISNAIRKFKVDDTYRVILLSSDSCNAGINLVEATDVILLDTVNGDKDASRSVEEQAIGRAVRLGQKNQVQVKRLIMKNTIEHEYYLRNYYGLEHRF